MLTKASTKPCFLCQTESSIQNLRTSYLVDCPCCGSYEIEALATTIDTNNAIAILSYLKGQRNAGKERPTIRKELLNQ